MKSKSQVVDAAASRFSDMPAYIAALPTDRRGYPIPFFTPVIDGVPDFTTADPRLMTPCIRKGLCWICGQRLGRMKAFVIGPMCSINRISSEPPSHPQCAEFAVKACPFMSRPLAKRPRVTDAVKTEGVAGYALTHNPGASLIWQTLRFKALPEGPSYLFEIGKPERTSWWRESRPATRQEILDSFELGLPYLRKFAALEGPEAEADLKARHADALQLLPAA